MTQVHSAVKFRGVLALLAAVAMPGAAGAGQIENTSVAVFRHTQPPASEAERLLASHNAERGRLGLPPLVWNADLARKAQSWATHLLTIGSLQHAPDSHRAGSGENLWMGTAGKWDSDAMVEMFLDERRYFREASFPDVSLTGNWTDVGHYSQIVWRKTREIGCAIDSGNGKDVLVCRYFPAGNVYGQDPY